jgi:hypothetical protein
MIFGLKIEKTWTVIESTIVDGELAHKAQPVYDQIYKKRAIKLYLY